MTASQQLRLVGIDLACWCGGRADTAWRAEDDTWNFRCQKHTAAASRDTPAYVFDLIHAWATGSPLDFHTHPVPQDVQDAVDEATE